MTWTRSLAGAVTVSAVAGWLIFRLWEPLGLPPRGGPLDAPFPGLWRWFFAVWFPALFPAFTVVHGFLLRWSERGEFAADVARAAARRDRLSYTLLPLFLLSMLGWRQVGDWRVPLAALFVAVLLGKVLLLVVSLYRGFVVPTADERDSADPPALRVQLFLAAFLLYVFLTPYVITAVSTAGDEQVYLLNTHSLYVDGDVDIGNNVKQRDYAGFYWGRPAPWEASFVGFPALLLPGYAAGKALLPNYPLAGRLGATLTIGLFAALLGLHVYRLCRELGASRAAAFWAWTVVSLTPPVLVHSSHVYPELPAAFAAVVAVRALLRLPEQIWPGLLAVTAAAFMVALKDRYLPLAFGLLVWAVGRAVTRRLLVPLALFVGLVGGGLFLTGIDPLALMSLHRVRVSALPGDLLAWDAYMLRAFLGILADQEFGLLYYGPHWALATVGIVPLWRRRREAALGLLGIFLLYLLVLAKYGWLQWDAGWTPPPRFILSAAPLLTPFIAEVFDRARGRILAAVNTLLLVWSGALAFCLSLVPFWRYNNLDGRSTLVQLAGDSLGLDLARFLPSLMAPTAWTWVALTLGGLLLSGGALVWTRRREARKEGWGIGAVLLSPFPAFALTAGLALLWIALAVVVPTWSIEAEAMRHSGGIQFGSYQHQDILWVMREEGEIFEPIVTWRGLTEIRVIAGASTTTGVAPRMTLLLDHQPVESWTLTAGQGQWVQAEYVARVRTAFGRPTLRLQFRDVVDHRGAGRLQHAYVDRIRLRRVGEAR